jgi:hypothetical protein
MSRSARRSSPSAKQGRAAPPLSQTAPLPQRGAGEEMEGEDLRRQETFEEFRLRRQKETLELLQLRRERERTAPWGGAAQQQEEEEEEEVQWAQRALETHPEAVDQFRKCNVNISQAFAAFDANGGGVIDRSEMRRGLAALNMNLTSRDIEDIIDHFDQDRSGRIEYSEIVRQLDRKQEQEPQQQQQKEEEAAVAAAAAEEEEEHEEEAHEEEEHEEDEEEEEEEEEEGEEGGEDGQDEEGDDGGEGGEDSEVDDDDGPAAIEEALRRAGAQLARAVDGDGAGGDEEEEEGGGSDAAVGVWQWAARLLRREESQRREEESQRREEDRAQLAAVRELRESEREHTPCAAPLRK